MKFESPFFLIFFIPIVFLLYLIAGKKLRGIVLLAASLFVYLWYDSLHLPLVIVFIAANYLFGRLIGSRIEKDCKPTGLLTAGIVMNLALLVFFKSDIAVVFSHLSSALFSSLSDHTISILYALPLGLSYIVFQALSYLLDVSKKRIPAEKSLIDFSQYILLFPKILAGPITRYKDISKYIRNNSISLKNVAAGIQRLIIGLAKKVLIADQMGVIIDNGIFSQQTPNATAGIAWLTLIMYSLQIYYDFSGYTDMAIGLGKMFGFQFIENFNYPYISKSISEFWRRWHISLSTWFRDYLFYPLERKRRKTTLFFLNQTGNTLIVFILTGLWHGLSLNFAVWGLIHGLTIAFENTPPGKRLKSSPAPLQHAFTLLVVMFSWVFFRSRDLPFAIAYFKLLAGFQAGDVAARITTLANPLTGILLVVVGIIFSMPLGSLFERICTVSLINTNSTASHWLRLGRAVGLLVLFTITLILMINSSYNPALYGKF